MSKTSDEIPARLLPVLRGVVGGHRNRDIANDCFLAEHTVEKYVSELLALFECSSRTELAVSQAARLAGEIGEVSGSTSGEMEANLASGAPEQPKETRDDG